MKSYKLFLFIIGIFIFPKFSFYFVSDFFCVYILLRHSKRIVFHNDLLRIVFIALFLLAILTILGQLYYGVLKPFWAYHLLRIPLYYYASITLLRVSGVSKETLVKYMLIVLLIALSGNWIELYFNEYFPSFFYGLKVESFLDAGGLKQVPYDFELGYRSSGYYANFQESGFLSLIGFIVSLYFILDKKKGSLVYLMSALVLVESIFGIISSGSRSALIGVVVSTIVFYISSFIFFKRKEKFIKMTVLLFFMGILLIAIISLLLENEDLKSRLLLLSNTFLLLQGETPSSLSKSFDQIILPDNSWVMLFGDGIQPWTTFGVSSDVGYVQLLWGTGILGLIVFATLYFICIIRSASALKRSQDLFYVVPLSLFIYLIIYGIKGNYFIGIHGGGDIAIFFLAVVMWYRPLSSKKSSRLILRQLRFVKNYNLEK
jgi:hypothetical protein